MVFRGNHSTIGKDVSPGFYRPDIVGVEKIFPRSAAGGSVAAPHAQYDRRIRALKSLDVSLIRYRATNDSMNRVRAMAVRTVNKLRVPIDGHRTTKKAAASRGPASHVAREAPIAPY